MKKLLNGFATLGKDSKEMIINMINTVIIKGGALIVALLATPAYMRFFPDDNVLGVWYTLLSILTWILTFDMGIGNGLRNELVVAIEQKDENLQKKYISSSYFFLIGIAIILGTIIFILIQNVNWNFILNVSTENITNTELTKAINIVFISVILQFVLRLITSIMFALQKAFIPNLLSLITNIIVLIYVVIANVLGTNNDIIKLSWIYLIAVNIPLILATIIIFLTKLKKVKPHLKFFDLKCAIKVFKTGSAFLLLQIAGMIIGNTCVVYLITFLLGAANVVEYNIYYKIYSQIYVMFTMILVPIWSAITKASTNKNYIWISKVLKKIKIIMIIFFIGQFALLPIMQNILNIWLRDRTIKANVLIQLVFIVNNAILMRYALTAQICNGLNELKKQMKWMLCAALLIVPISIVFTKLYNHYISIILAQTVSILPYCIFQTIWMNNYIKSNIKEN